MFFTKIFYCRAFQTMFRLAMPILPYREPKIINSCALISNVLNKENIHSVLIVTDRGIVNNGLITQVEDSLLSSGISYSVYADTQTNPTVQNVEDALEIYKTNNCNGLIAIGGGSVMDCAKAVGARVAYPKKRLNQLRGILRVLRKIPTLIAIPTTAGTGSETTLAALVTDSSTHHKYAIMSFPLIPHYAVLDASLTYSLPAHLTATTGMDALTHAVEAYIGRSTTKETRQLALDATKLIFENLERAYENGLDHEARAHMLHASYKAGIAFSKSYVGYIHAIAHSLGGTYGTPHGLANAVLMPHVLTKYGKHAHKKLHELAIAVDIATPKDTPMTGALKFINAIKELNARMNIPCKLPGIKEDDIPAMAKLAEKEANPLYPVPKVMPWKELAKFYYQLADWSI